MGKNRLGRLGFAPVSDHMENRLKACEGFRTELGRTPGHRQNGAGRGGGRAPHHLTGFALRLGGDGTGVDHRGVRRLPEGNNLPAGIGHALGQSLAFVLIDLAAECAE